MLPHLRTPDGWSSALELSLQEPDRPAPVDPRILKAGPALPGARINVARVLRPDADPRTACAEFTTYLVEHVVGARSLSDHDFNFDDGSLGPAVTVELTVEGIVWQQRHIYRFDAPFLTHLTLSVTKDQAARLTTDLRAWAASFKP